MNGDTIVSIVAILAALVLALRGLKSRPMMTADRLTMAAVWIVIIVGVVFLIHSIGVGNKQ